MSISRRYFFSATVVSFFLVSVASAQNIWEGDDITNSTSWHVAANWSDNAVPNSSSEVLVGAPAPTIISTASANVLTLEVTSNGEIEIHGSRALTFSGDSLVNNGVITVNSNNSASISTLNLLNQGVEIEGSGEIVLAAPGSLANLTNNTQPFIHGVDHTIRGEGQIAAQVINNGTITAEDINGDETAELFLTSGLKTNNGIIQSSPTSGLRSNTNISQGANGRIIADTSEVFLGNITVSGGKLESTNGGVFRTSGNALTFDGVDDLNGQINLVSGGGLTGNLVVRGGGFSNNGTILVNQDNVGASGLRFGESGTIDGTGEIILNSPGGGANISSDTADAVGTLGPNQTVRGVGRISAELINDGTIIAEPRSDGTQLEFQNIFNPKTNNKLIRADAGSTIRITATTINQDDANGQIFANGGTVELAGNSLIKGGRLEAAGDGKFVVLGNPGRFEDVVSNAPIEVQAGANNMSLLGSSFVNNSTVSVGSNLRIDGDVTISGTGEIQLGIHTGCCTGVTVSSGFTATNAAGHTIRGLSGGFSLINGPGTLINDGLLEGAGPTELLDINTRIGGSGTLKNVRSDTALAPGSAVGETAQITLEGALTIANLGATVELEIGGTTPGLEYDQLLSTDPTNLITIGGGSTQLNVSFINSFFPANGDIFTLIDTVGTITGDFGAINLPPLPSGFAWADVSDANTIAYQLIAPLAADFDEDGDVDGDDLTLWQTGYGTSSEALKMDGDAEEDGDVDGRDFLIWQRQFGNGVPLVASVAVPEPNAVLLSLVGLFVLSTRSNRRQC